ncbi:prolyl 4-Hydroxylase alpha-subunit, region, partial [Onchocerca flexuosa]
FSQEIQERSDKAIRDCEEVIRHPINGFLLIKDLITDWNKAVNIMRSNSADDVIRNMTRQKTTIKQGLREMFSFARTTDPDHPRAKDNICEYEYLLENDGIQRIDMRRDILPIKNERDENNLDEGLRLMYETLCRQKNKKSPSGLYCYYKMDRPYLRLAPFKVEIVRQDSLVALVYDIVSEEEARIIKMLAVPK